MFLGLIGTSLAFGAAALGAAVYSEGALVALRTAAELIGWLFALASLAGLAGVRSASAGQVGAAVVTLCASVTVLYMSYFLEWREDQPVAISLAAAETLPPRPVEPKVIAQPQVFAAIPPVDVPVIRTAKAATSDSCSALTGVESLQCRRCGGMSNFAWLACQEQVRLDYCASGAGDERTCPSPIPASYPG
jgi:hypothetical protein